MVWHLLSFSILRCPLSSPRPLCDLGPFRSQERIGDRIAPVDERELSRTARHAFERLGRGLVLLVNDGHGLAPQSAFIAEADVEDYLCAMPSLSRRALEAVHTYAPEAEYVLLEIGRAERPQLKVRALVGNH